jgi:hypothetical protein
MTITEKNIIIKKNIRDVFEILYENNTSIFSEHMQLIEWHKSEWEIKKTLRQRKERIYIYLPSIPDEVVKYLSENDKYLMIEAKNKFIVDTSDSQKIKTKIKILNMNPFFKTLINDLHMVSIKNTIVLQQIEDNATNVKIKIKVVVNIPKTKKINEFISTLMNSLLYSTVQSLG